MRKFGDSGARIESCYDGREFSYCKSSFSTDVDIASCINEVIVALLNKAKMYVQCNNIVRSCNHCSRGKGISISYSETVFVALDVQHEMRMRHIVTCALLGSTVSFHLI